MALINDDNGLCDRSCLRMLCSLFMKCGKLESAEKGFVRLLLCEDSCDVSDYVNGGICAFQLNKVDVAITRFNHALVLDGNSIVALANLSGISIKKSDFQHAYQYSRRAITLLLDHNDFSDFVSLKVALNNFNVSARLVANSLDAIQLSNNVIDMFSSLSTSWLPNYLPAIPVESVNTVVIACVKWKTKYGPEYVNRLHKGVLNNLHHFHDIKFVCITDDVDGIDEDIHCIHLDEEKSTLYPAWWAKIWLFDLKSTVESEYSNLVLYFDLDTVICGPIDFLIEIGLANVNQHLLGILETGDMINESNRQGLNSSIMLFRSGSFRNVLLSSMVRDDAIIPVHDIIFKFDHWIEMKVIETGLFYSIQALSIGKIVEFSQIAGGDPMENCSVVCFPLQPKPHQVTNLDWVKHYWEEL